MRTRAPALAAVVAFAAAIALVAGLAGRGGDPALVKLPFASLAGDAVADTAAASTSERSALMAPAFGPVEYRLGGPLPELPGTAPAYRLGSVASTAAVARLAAALGVDGDVSEEDGAWVVRDGDRQLRVERFPGLPWYLGSACPEATVSSEVAARDADAGTTSVVASCAPAVSSGSGGGSSPSAAGCAADACADVASPANVPAAEAVPPGRAVAVDCDAPGTACSVPAPPPCPPGAECAGSIAPVPPDAPLASPMPAPVPAKPERPADLPSRAEAERLARETFTRMGVAQDGFSLEDGWLTWEARVEPRVDGLAVMGLGTGLGIGGGGAIVHANGFLAVPDRIGDYPLVGAEAGIRRLQDGSGGATRTLAAVDAREPATAPAGAEPAVDLPAVLPDACADPAAPCEPVPMPNPEPAVRTATGARLVLLQFDAVLVPAYVYDLDDGGESPPVPAVTDEWLASQAVPEKG